MTMIDGDAEWERLFADPRSPLLLDKLMEEVMFQVSNTATASDTTWTERDDRLRDIRGRGVDDMPEPESTQPWQEHMMEQVTALIAWRHEQRAEIATLKRQCKQLRDELVGLRERMAEYEADS